MKKHSRSQPHQKPVDRRSRQKTTTSQTLSSEPITFHVTSLSHEGRGVAMYGANEIGLVENDLNHSESTQAGKKVFIRYALVGETVKAKLTKSHKRFDEAEMVELLSAPSKDRIQPSCKHFGQCGGCALQHLDVEAQLQHKQQVLASHLKHFANVEPVEWLTPIQNQKADYRRRARLGVRWLAKSQQLIIGFREVQSNHLTPISECTVLDQRVSTHLDALRNCLSQLDIRDKITHLEFALGDEDVALVLRHTVDMPQQDIDKLLDFVKSRAWQLYLLPDRYQSLRRIDQPDAIMRLHYALPAFDLKLAFSPMDFTQVNANVNQQTVSLACQLLELKTGERVLDLFCGLGNFSFALARCVGATGQVVAVEGVDEMVYRGNENATLNQIDHVQFYQQDLASDFSDQAWARQGFDALLIDPPRAGASQVMHYVANFKAKRIVYVSCDPATLARDTAILIAQGYQLCKAGVMDMFTHTEHVESMTLFKRIDATMIDLMATDLNLM